jgi:FkbM family methyltransferase
MRLRDLTEQLASRASFQSFAQILGHAELEKQRTSDLDFRRLFLQGALASEKLQYLDIGARGGPLDRMKSLRAFYDIVLCEPDPTEAENLRGLDYTVVEKLFLDGAKNSQTLYITEKPSNSSIYKPRLEIIPLTHGSIHAVRIVEELELPVTTVDAEENRLGLKFDEIKIDVQGANIPVLEGMRTSRPFLIELEAEMVELYHGQPLFFDVGRYLYDRGYLVADLVMTRRNGRPAGGRLPNNRRNSRGIAAYGDFLFMPDWSRAEGRAIIERAPLRWSATLILNGYEDMVRWISADRGFHGADQVLEVLERVDKQTIESMN